MGKQIYICWEEGQAEKLFHYVQEQCGMIILPMKKTNSTSTNADAIPCVFVQEEAAGLFRYKRFRDENGEPEVCEKRENGRNLGIYHIEKYPRTHYFPLFYRG